MKDLWTYLASTDKPIVIYGMGNGADKILSVFDIYNIKVSGIFASDGFVRKGKTFHGFPVESYADISAKYEDFIVIVSFASSLDNVIENIVKIAEERELYAPAVPVYGDTLFNYEYYLNHKDELNTARNLLSDDESKHIFDNIIKYRLSGKIEYLFSAQSDCEEIQNNILSNQIYKTFLDCGAYTGDTAAEFIRLCPNAERIFALEPDLKNFDKLKRNMQNEHRVISINKGAWDKSEKVEFSVGAGRGASTKKSSKSVILDFCAPDELFADEKIDYIKYDVEGAEEKAIVGSKKIISEQSPDMLVSLYHRSEDIFKLPLLVNSINKEYKFYLRRFRYIPDWDLNLYAVKKDIDF